METIEEKCSSFVKDKEGKSIPCKNKGEKRYHHDLYAGVHCNTCWNNMILEYQQKSW